MAQRLHQELSYVCPSKMRDGADYARSDVRLMQMRDISIRQGWDGFVSFTSSAEDHRCANDGVSVWMVECTAQLLVEVAPIERDQVRIAP